MSKRNSEIHKKFEWLSKPIDITNCNDSNWAGDLLTRKNTNGNARVMVSHAIKNGHPHNK